MTVRNADWRADGGPYDEGMSSSTELIDYYAQRAAGYERIYAKPERQVDLSGLRLRLSELCTGRAVYEVACGTGYWTQVIANKAASVFATDRNEAVLALARAKTYPSGRVTWAVADAFDLPPSPRTCDAGLAAFWWSHVRNDSLDRFVSGFFARLGTGARFIFMDNRYVEGSSTPVARTDPDGNTYQCRRLDDGSEHVVLKNFPAEADLVRQLAPHARSVHWETCTHYWLVWGDVR